MRTPTFLAHTLLRRVWRGMGRVGGGLYGGQGSSCGSHAEPNVEAHSRTFWTRAHVCVLSSLFVCLFLPTNNLLEVPAARDAELVRTRADALQAVELSAWASGPNIGEVRKGGSRQRVRVACAPTASLKTEAMQVRVAASGNMVLSQ